MFERLRIFLINCKKTRTQLLYLLLVSCRKDGTNNSAEFLHLIIIVQVKLNYSSLVSILTFHTRLLNREKPEHDPNR